MPTASQYLSAAATVDGHITPVAKDERTVTSLVGDSGVVGGNSQPIIDEGLGAIAADANGLGSTLSWLCNSLRSKAELCRRYTIDMAQWRHELAEWNAIEHRIAQGEDVDQPGPRPLEPPRPFPEAEEGE